DEVKYLQIVLKTETPETYPADVPATGWFGPITKASVITFQEKYVSEILAPWDLTTGTGFVGSTTGAKLNSLLTAVPTEEKEVTPEILEIPAERLEEIQDREVIQPELVPTVTFSAKYSVPAGFEFAFQFAVI
ncbi:unnamed protein product, partial [marine sediment metagenome]